MISLINGGTTFDQYRFFYFLNGNWDYMTTTLHKRLNIIDLLVTNPTTVSLKKRIEQLRLSSVLQEKTIAASRNISAQDANSDNILSVDDEKELSAEVLLLRHRFTEIIYSHRVFRQAAITIIQNIYLFQERKIFFGTLGKTGDAERQEALFLFSGDPSSVSIPLSKTFQHFILARVWDRITSQANSELLESSAFAELHNVVEQLNTLRNIYMILTTRLVYKLTGKINSIYKQSIAMDDAHQIGSFGVARAAYRYHYSSGFRFSTFASRWVLKEIQRQSLESRLIKISSNTVENFSKATRFNDENLENITNHVLSNATVQLKEEPGDKGGMAFSSNDSDPSTLAEKKEFRVFLKEAVDNVLSAKSSDIIKRRYGLPPYDKQEQSVIDIAKTYGVTRGSIYQLEQQALKKLNNHFRIALKERVVA